jgi:hypothetical protein
MTVGTKNPIPPKPIEPSQEQSIPLGPYYETILNNPQPLPKDKPEEAPASSTDDGPPTPPPPQPPSKPPRGRKPKEEKTASATPPLPTPTPSSSNPSTGAAQQSQSHLIFGSRLLGPAERAERLAAMRDRSTLVAGVLVPPRPDEPDNCCMSGCVNCVWDRYRDEVEAWAGASREAERRLRAQEAGMGMGMGGTMGAEAVGREPEVVSGSGVSGRGGGGGIGVGMSMDDDGGGSSSTWDLSLGDGRAARVGKAGTGLVKDFWDDELYRNVPVGIREFMKQEKRLKEKHEREGTVGG